MKRSQNQICKRIRRLQSRPSQSRKNYTGNLNLHTTDKFGIILTRTPKDFEGVSNSTPCLCDSSGLALQYDRLSISPDERNQRIWFDIAMINLLKLERDITGIAWAFTTIPMGGGLATVLATTSADKKVKLWVAPLLQPQESLTFEQGGWDKFRNEFLNMGGSYKPRIGEEELKNS
ncbi:hypothetical protein HHK36_028748 [Tetracentron sinense]|uniref:Uncharacterized protein n=1 Tax=Tetracentron sinense TaxID=13715 RepID=A0A835D0W5_TETSI|nr:hypothetical protein HHK36_028748 [Tetracentron sinense]